MRALLIVIEHMYLVFLIWRLHSSGNLIFTGQISAPEKASFKQSNYLKQRGSRIFKPRVVTGE